MFGVKKLLAEGPQTRLTLKSLQISRSLISFHWAAFVSIKETHPLHLNKPVLTLENSLYV